MNQLQAFILYCNFYFAMLEAGRKNVLLGEVCGRTVFLLRGSRRVEKLLAFYVL